MKLMDLITEDKVIRGKDYKILGYADKDSGNITFKLISWFTNYNSQENEN